VHGTDSSNGVPDWIVACHLLM